MTIQIPDDLARGLAGIAAAQKKSVEQLALERLRSLFDDASSPAAVLRAIRELPHPSFSAEDDLDVAIAAARPPVRDKRHFDGFEECCLANRERIRQRAAPTCRRIRSNRIVAEYIRFSRTPCDVFLIQCPTDLDSPLRGEDARAVLTKLFIDNCECEFRGVSLDRLGTILQQGIDVHPTTGLIFVDFPDKAVEYGGWPKVLLALKRDLLRRTFREISADSSEEEIQTVCREFPNIVKSIDGSKLWCTRLDKDDPRIASSYENAYARWIPDDPWAALKAVFVLFRPEDQSEFERVLRSMKDQQGAGEL